MGQRLVGHLDFFFFFFLDFSSSVNPLQLWVFTPTGIAHLRANSHVQVRVAKKAGTGKCDTELIACCCILLPVITSLICPGVFFWLMVSR